MSENRQQFALADGGKTEVRLPAVFRCNDRRHCSILFLSCELFATRYELQP